MEKIDVIDIDHFTCITVYNIHSRLEHFNYLCKMILTTKKCKTIAACRNEIAALSTLLKMKIPCVCGREKETR